MGASLSAVRDSNTEVVVTGTATSNQNALEKGKTAATTVARLCKASNTNRIMVFHSKASWSAYHEATKAFPNLVVIYFTTTWYEPCRHMEPTFNAIATKYTNVEFIKIDVDELLDISRQYGVRTTPTFLFLKKGKEIDKVIGAKKEELQRKIEKHTYKEISIS